MRKLMNKKGFSLVELMIVVVIMGILIAVAIPLYGAIKDNANNKTCANNIKTIKSNAANYVASYEANLTKKAELASMFDDNTLPDCPFNTAKDHTSYTIYIATSNGAAAVACKYATSLTEKTTNGHSKGASDLGGVIAAPDGYNALT